uniref:Family with sequence similarity 184 member Ab n=1 Tax=Callorhinchus milii TaxID=7868 RepID=A0A4W3HB87_CALMI
MATGMSWQQQQQHYSGAAASQPGAGGGQPASVSHWAAEYNQDLHLKMSKKIAQLTKVIYALNTKNDEHEVAIQTLKEAHEEEIQKILIETREKILQYKSKISEEVEVRKRIQSLEESLEQHEKVKQQVLAEFGAYKQKVEEAQLRMETNHLQGVVVMSREIQEMKKTFEEKLQHFMQLEFQFKQHNEVTLEDLQTMHKLEIQELLRTHHNQYDTLNKEKGKLEQVHQAELDALNNKIEEFKLEKVKLVDEFEAKLRKAQAFYEHELEALKQSQKLSSESLLLWKQKDTELKIEFQTQEAALKKELGKLQMDLKIAQEEAHQLSSQCQQLQHALERSKSHMQILQKQLEESQQEASSALVKQNELEDELINSRDRIQQQCTDLLLKSSHIGTLQATQMNHESTIRELELEQYRLKEKISYLEEERNLLQNKNQSLDERQCQQRLALEKYLNEEKEMQQRNYEKEILNLQRNHKDETTTLKENSRKNVAELSQKHQVALDSLHETNEKEQKKMQSVSRKHNVQNYMCINHCVRCITKYGVCRLQDLVKKSEQGLGSAEGHISSLKDAQERLQKELDYSRAKLRETSDSLSSAQGELEHQRQEYEARLTTAKEEEKLQLKKFEQDLEQKWKATLRYQHENLREELGKQHSEETRSALAHLSHLKEQDINADKVIWQKKVEDLMNQISLLKQNLEMQLSESQASLQKLQCQFNHERQRLTQQLQEMQEEHKQRQMSVEDAHQIAIRKLEESKERELTASCNTVLQHMEELQSLKETHRLNIETLQKETRQQLQNLKTELEEEGVALLASVRSELNYQHAIAIDQLSQGQQQELAGARKELDWTIDLHRLKELLERISKLEEEAQRREHRIKELDEENLSVHENLNTLTKELEMKGKEVLKIRSEANQQIRAYEQDIHKKQEKELKDLEAARMREMQSMLTEFDKAQELLKEKISVSEHMLEEAEEKYRNREARPEDLQFINELKEMITERDQLMKKLMDDKKFYQLELVNRETNFNKVFNANPNVGVINPLAKQKKKNDKIASRFVSAPNLSAVESAGVGNGQQQNNRLEPIPNSPVHDVGFNSVKPLPQPIPPKETKRFLR